MNIEALAHQIDAIQHTLQAQAAHAVNLALTARNWLIGYYIVEFEQNGEDRAAYGEQLLKKLESRLHTKGLTERRFREFRRLYQVYPQLQSSVMQYLNSNTEIRRLATAEFKSRGNAAGRQSACRYSLVYRKRRYIGQVCDRRA